MRTFVKQVFIDGWVITVRAKFGNILYLVFQIFVVFEKPTSVVYEKAFETNRACRSVVRHQPLPQKS